MHNTQEFSKRTIQVQKYLEDVIAYIDSPLPPYADITTLIPVVYRAILAGEQHWLDTAQRLREIREYVGLVGARTMETLIPMLAYHLHSASSDTPTMLSIGCANAKKEEHIARVLKQKYNQRIAVAGIEADFGLETSTPKFLQERGNSFHLMHLQESRQYIEVASLQDQEVFGFMSLSAHHTELPLQELLRRCQGFTLGLFLVEELAMQHQLDGVQYNLFRAAIETYFNRAFGDEYPPGFDFGTLRADYYSEREMIEAGGQITHIEGTSLPPTSVVWFPGHLLS